VTELSNNYQKLTLPDPALENVTGVKSWVNILGAPQLMLSGATEVRPYFVVYYLWPLMNWNICAFMDGLSPSKSISKTSLINLHISANEVWESN